MTAEELEQPLEESTFWDEEEVQASFHHIRKGMSESTPRLNGISTFTDFCRFGDLLKTHKVQVGGKCFFHKNTRKFKIVEESTIEGVFDGTLSIDDFEGLLKEIEQTELVSAVFAANAKSSKEFILEGTNMTGRNLVEHLEPGRWLGAPVLDNFIKYCLYGPYIKGLGIRRHQANYFTFPSNWFKWVSDIEESLGAPVLHGISEFSGSNNGSGSRSV